MDGLYHLILFWIRASWSSLLEYFGHLRLWRFEGRVVGLREEGAGFPDQVADFRVKGRGSWLTDQRLAC